MIKFPLFYETTVKSQKGMSTDLEAKSQQFKPLSCAIPKDFGGSGSTYSPEELFSITLLTCLVSSFKSFAEMNKLDFDSIEAVGKLTLDTVGHSPAFTKFEVVFTVAGASDQKKADSLLTQSANFCPINNCTTLEKKFTHRFI